MRAAWSPEPRAPSWAAVVSLLLLFGAPALAQGAPPVDPAAGEEPSVAGELEPAPLDARTHDGGTIADAFMEGFREGLREDDLSGGATGQPGLSDDEAAALGFFSLCCCFLFFVGLVVLVVVLVKKSKGASPPVAAPAAAPVAGSAPPGGTHLSVLAVAFDARVRTSVEGSLRAAGASASPMSGEARAVLVRTLCRALLDASSNWRAFGYGDKTDFPDDAAAEASFRAAWSDFKGRCLGPGEPGGELCVAVLVLCSRGAVLGTSRLEDPVQARALLQHRMGLAPELLLAADCFFAPPDASTSLTQSDAFRRFPEMQPLGPG
jgi:Protein of unknown function (DUF1517)